MTSKDLIYSQPALADVRRRKAVHEGQSRSEVRGFVLLATFLVSLSSGLRVILLLFFDFFVMSLGLEYCFLGATSFSSVSEN